MNAKHSLDTPAPICRTARIASVGVSAAFGLILFLALTNEDKPQGAALPVLALLALTIVASLAAWRWPRTGGYAVLAGAVAVGVAAYRSSVAFELGSAGLPTSLLYAGPFVIVGALFVLCARDADDLPRSSGQHSRTNESSGQLPGS